MAGLTVSDFFGWVCFLTGDALLTGDGDFITLSTVFDLVALGSGLETVEGLVFSLAGLVSFLDTEAARLICSFDVDLINSF